MTGPEKKFENMVRKYLDSKGCWHLKTFSNGVQRSGVPDLLISYMGRMLAMEVKSADGEFNNALQPFNIRKINLTGNIAGVLIPTEGKERFRRYVAKHYPEYTDTPIYDFEDFKQIMERLEREYYES